MLQKYYPKHCLSVLSKDTPRTTNSVWRAIGEFEKRYQLTKVFTIYYRIRKIKFGCFKGKNRLELRGNPVGKLSFADLLTTSFC